MHHASFKSFVAVIVVLLPAVLPAALPGPESAEFAAQRAERTHRQRRAIYNSDGGDIFGVGADTPEGFLAQRMNATLGSQVDTVYYCTGATVMFSHDARVGEVYGKHPVEVAWAAEAPKNIEGLRQAGTDTLRLVVDFCHRNDLEVFYTHRINDIHDSTASCDFELATWKRENPQFHLSPREEQDKHGADSPRFWWSALDFEHVEARRYLLDIVTDICRRYDVDGYDVDYFRSPMFFKPNLDFEPATESQLDILTDFQRRIRQIAYAEGNRRGRPMLVSVRVPMTVDRCRHVGIDIERWLEEDLFDVLTIGGGYVPFTMPTREMVELGHAHGKPVYPTISASGFRKHYRGVMPAWRGAAMSAWASGADGIVLFNTFPRDPGHPHFNELGDRRALGPMDKLFAIDNRKITEGDLVQGIHQDQILPLALPPGEAATAELPVGDDVSAAARSGLAPRLALHVRFEGAGDPKSVLAKMNEQALEVLDPKAISETVEGRLGRAYAFDETNILTAGKAESLQLGDSDFSFSFWIRTTQKVNWSGFVVFVVEDSQQPGVKLYWNSGRLNVSLRSSERDESWDVAGGDMLLDGHWHHYAASFDRQGEAVVYLDGKVVGRHDVSGLKGSLGSGKTLLLGKGDDPFQGLMDDVRLYHRVLKENEVAHLAGGQDPDADALRGHWKFDEPTGRTFADASGHGNVLQGYVRGDGRQWMFYALRPDMLRFGSNRLTFQSPQGGRVTHAELHVKYGTAP